MHELFLFELIDIYILFYSFCKVVFNNSIVVDSHCADIVCHSGQERELLEELASLKDPTSTRTRSNTRQSGKLNTFYKKQSHTLRCRSSLAMFVKCVV